MLISAQPRRSFPADRLAAQTHAAEAMAAATASPMSSVAVTACCPKKTVRMFSA